MRLLHTNEKLPPLGRILINSLVASSCISRGEHRECHRMVAESLNIVAATGIHIFDFMILTSSAYSWLGTGEFGQIPPLLEKMQAMLPPYAMWDHAQYHCLSAWHAMQIGKLAEAKAEAETAVEQAKFCGSPFPVALCRVVQSQVHLELGEPEIAEKLLEDIRNESRLCESKMIRFLVGLVSADCAYAQKRVSEAEQYCKTAFASAGAEDVWMPYGLSNRRLGAVCARALEAGIEDGTVVELIRRWQLKPPDTERVSERWPWPVRIYTLGRFAIHCNGTPLLLSVKTPRKPLELLALLVCAGQAGVSREKLADRLWPDSDGDLALQTLNTTLHRLRRLFGNNEAVVQKDGQLLLNGSLCWNDSWHFQWQTQQIEATEGDQAVAEKHITRALEIYQGAFVPGHEHLSMVVGYASRLNRQQADVVAAALPLFVRMDTGKGLKKAVLRTLTEDETATAAFPVLIDKYRKNNSEREAVDILHRCRMLLVENGIAHDHQALRNIDNILNR